MWHSDNNTRKYSFTNKPFSQWKSGCKRNFFQSTLSILHIVRHIPKETDFDGCRMKFTLLKNQIIELQPNAHEVEIEQYVKVYTLCMIEGMLMLEKFGSAIHFT
ncbi:hypothetical protein J1N35_012517, partial [Gossypium stocksii]